MTRHTTAKRLCITLVMLCGCAETESGNSTPHEETATVSQALSSDPALAATSGWCRDFRTYDGIQGRIYYPSNAGCSQSVYSPLVVLIHARGTFVNYTHEDYHYLQRHLARNGFISVIAETGDSAPDVAATDTWNYVDDVWRKWSKRAYIDPSSVALIGHSRGGAAVRYLAHSLEGDPIFHVKSVVGLAAANQGPSLDGHQTEGYLQLYGTTDGDTGPGSTFTPFDNAGDNGSQLDPAWNDDVLYKSVKLLEDATHGSYADGNAAQNSTVMGYVLAFLAAHNKGDLTWYEDYIRADNVPGTWASPVFTSYSDGFYRRVIDNFDDGVAANTTIGGALATWNASAKVVDPGYPHDGDVLWMWGKPDGLVTWTIPVGKRDASAFEWLSLRIAQLSGAAANDLRIQIRNGVTWSPEVRLTDHGQVPQPTDMCYGQNGGGCLPADLEVVNHLGTIRVPLSAFGAHNDVQHVRVRFRGDSAVDTFMIDNLEFSEWILKP